MVRLVLLAILAVVAIAAICGVLLRPPHDRRAHRTWSQTVVWRRSALYPRELMPVPPAPPPVRRDVLSPDPAEHTLLVELRRDPADADVRMVYGDLLEHRGEVAKANFLRGNDDDDDPDELLDGSDVAWRTLVSRDPVACQVPTCPRTWDRFAPVADDERCRRCIACAKLVRYCATIAEERASLERGERALVDRGGGLRDTVIRCDRSRSS